MTSLKQLIIHRPRQRWLALALGILTSIGLTLWVCFSCLFGLGFFDSHPTDDELVTNFYKHRADFEQLRLMYIPDREIGQITPEFTRGSISQARWNEYRTFFRILHLESGISGYPQNKQIWFDASSVGIVPSGSSKGYVYSTEALPIVTGELEANRSDDGEYIYKHIEEHWYLYYEWT